VLGLVEIFIWLLSGLGWFWPIFPIFVLAGLYAAHAWLLPRLAPEREAELLQRVSVLTRSRSGALDVQAAELRRIERDLHDGAQARMVSLAMSLGLAARLVRTDPDAAADLLDEARASTVSALDELRDVVHGIHPPVLADRGLAGAVEALALDLAVPVTVTADIPERLPAPVESAAYFATAECLANVVKHSGASRAWVDLAHRDGRLSVIVGDNGAGGARLDRGSGLAGVVRRLEAFDGTVQLSSPAGGPTTVTMEVPCASSSPKISPFSATD
jgi:signal transduction histidine kinase